MPHKPSRITLAQHAASHYFDTIHLGAFVQHHLYQLIEEKRIEWDLPATTPPGQVAARWVSNGFLRSETILVSNGEEITLLLYQEPSVYEVAVALRSRAYVSHYPAVFLHGLTTQVPRTIYTTRELSAKRPLPGTLSQPAIDQAFAQPQRRAQLQATYQEYTLVLLSGKHSNHSGVLTDSRDNSGFAVTNLERTLIDSMVRPGYAGGSFAVLGAFGSAVADRINAPALVAHLKALSLIYPYQQALGFYLERAGYTGGLLDTLSDERTGFDFYLDYGMESRSYDPYWKIWYPGGM